MGMLFNNEFSTSCKTTCGFIIVVLFTLSFNAAWGQSHPVSTITVEAETGMIIHEENADIVRPPASMVKMMKMFMVSEGVNAGLWDLQMNVTVSARAASMWGSRIILREGETQPLYKFMEAIAVASANDASVAVAEALWGSEAAYLKAATQRARDLGMSNTTFRTTNGLPPDDGVSFDETTARDMATLARNCIKDPRVMAWAGMREMQFRPTDAVRTSTNLLLSRMEECDGLKTGYIRAAGFCISATAVRNGIRLITVVMGSPDKWSRFNLAQALLESGFEKMARQRVLAGGAALGDYIPVNNCEVNQLRLITQDDLWITLPSDKLNQLEFVAVYPEYLNAPLPAGTVVGQVRVKYEDNILGSIALTVPHDLEAKGWYLVMANGEARWEGLNREHSVQ